MALKLWLIKQPEKNVRWDCYDSAVVVARDAVEAMTIHPDGSQRWHEGRGWVYAKGHDGQGTGWTVPTNVTAEIVGTAAKKLEAGHVVCASFNAG